MFTIRVLSAGRIFGDIDSGEGCERALFCVMSAGWRSRVVTLKDLGLGRRLASSALPQRTYFLEHCRVNRIYRVE